MLVNNAQTGKNIHLAAGFGGMSIDEGTVIKASNRVIDLKKISLDENGEFVVATEANLNPISNVLIPNTVLAVAEGKKGLGADRVNEILNSLNNLSDQEAEKALNSIALMGVGSGAQTAALNFGLYSRFSESPWLNPRRLFAPTFRSRSLDRCKRDVQQSKPLQGRN